MTTSGLTNPIVSTSTLSLRETKMDEVEVEIKPGTYPNLDDIIVEDDVPTILLPCIICNKTFKPEALQRHSKACEKNATKKRKTFDSFKQRVQGTDLAEFLPYSTLQKRVSVTEKPPSPKKTSSHWKEKHEAFVSAIRAARGSGCEVGGSGEPRSSLRAPDHEQCPYCERHFGPKAFDRHQEWCREQHSRHPPSVASQQAKERLEARIKYRAPPLKSKRALTREKYSPLVQRKARQVSPSSNSSSSNNGSVSHSASAGSTRSGAHTSLLHQQELSNRLSRSGHLSGRSQGKDNSSAPALNRGMAARTSMRASQKTAQRSVSPTKSNIGSSKPLSSSSSLKDGYRAHDGGCEDMFLTCNVKKLQPGGRINQGQLQVLGNQKSAQQKQYFNEETKLRQTDIDHTSFVKEEKESINMNNNIKNKKNDQKCRPSSLANPSCMLRTIPQPSASPNVTPRKVKNRQILPPPCKVNSIEVNSLLTEITVSPCNVPCMECTYSDDCVIPERTSSNRTVCLGRALVDLETDSVSGCSMSSTSTEESNASAESSSTYITHPCEKKQGIGVPVTQLELYCSFCQKSLRNEMVTNLVVCANCSVMARNAYHTEKNHQCASNQNKLQAPPSEFTQCMKQGKCFVCEIHCTLNSTSYRSPEERVVLHCPSVGIDNRSVLAKKCNKICLVDQQTITSDFMGKGFTVNNLQWLDSTSSSETVVKFETSDNGGESPRASECIKKKLEVHEVRSYKQKGFPNCCLSDSQSVDCENQSSIHSIKLPLISVERKRPLGLRAKKTDEFQNCPTCVHPPCSSSQAYPLNQNPMNQRLQPLSHLQTKIQLCTSGNQTEEPYDPYASAERQMLELLHSDSARDVSMQTHDRTNRKQHSSAQCVSPVHSPEQSHKPSSLETSLTSAFTRYTKDLESSQQQTQKVPQTPNSPQTQTQPPPQTIPQILSHTPPTSPQTVQQNPAQVPSSPKCQTQAEHQPESQTITTSQPQLKPLPPPRSFKRSASMQSSMDTSGFRLSKSQLQSFHSIDNDFEANNNISYSNLDNRPGTYDVESKNEMKGCVHDQNSWVGFAEQCGSRGMDTSVVQDDSNGVRSEVLMLEREGEECRKIRRETRESREIREINEKTCDISEIDSLLEEVVRMQHSVSMLNASETQPHIQSTARSRRNRAGKMHIEDYLFPAELLRREEISLSDSSDHFGHSSLVFGSTKLRRGPSKGRKLIEDMLFPTSDVDINANSDTNEDGDVIVSANALMGVCTPPAGFGPKTDQLQDLVALAPSPVALTSKVIDDDDDGLPRPKPLVSTRSLQSSIKTERTEPQSTPGSPTPTNTHQTPNRQSTSSRLSADSAYSSLNRRSPVPHTRRQVMSGGSKETLQRYNHGADSPQTIAQQSLVLSSSSSESSLPPLSAVNTSRSNTQGKQDLDSPCPERLSDSTPLFPKLSKFCHECGTRFPVSVAKFCHECGARRLEL